jgi:hypothetical protein
VSKDSAQLKEGQVDTWVSRRVPLVQFYRFDKLLKYMVEFKKEKISYMKKLTQ